jgi:endo-1,4-beta-xylanase
MRKLLLIGTMACVATVSQAALIFFGGVTDPLVNTFPDTIFTGLNIWNGINANYSDLQAFVQTDANSFNWSNFDQVTSFAHANKLHRVWYGGYIGSNSLTDNLFSSLGLSGSALVAAETNFVAAAAARDQPEYINLCNEALTNSSGAFQQAFGGAGATGVDWIINLSKLFRQYFPNAKLGINDLGFESVGSDLQYGYGSSRLPALMPLFQALVNAGAIDWIGEEGYSLESASTSNLQASIQQIGTLGTHIVMTEFSPDAYAGPNVDPNKVMADWQRLLPIYAQSPVVWGVTGPWDYRWSNTQGGGVAGSEWIVDNLTNPFTNEPVVGWLQGYVPTILQSNVPD